YSTFGAEAGHLLTASFMTAPAAILLAKILVPETEKPITAGGEKIQVPVETHNIVDAAAHGTAQGLQMALHVGATLIVFIGLVYLLDLIFQSITGTTFVDTLGYVFRPVAWLLGIPSQDVAEVAKLLGKKTVLNEFVSYLDLKVLIETNAISQRSITIATYALCSFANPGSIGITLAGLDAIAPSRRADVAKLCFKAFVGGALASLMTACIAGVILYE
ncbi:MAG TPA: nucleoside transporter C-terminal domain-containing protein, partial [Candidatus Hydrogenedentes bacterium]|nr:nucleoside transporter C-terminal domain-containing protein [Candidatus Hydrogenedentota bacterium]